jgi:hypothetical protein
MRIWLAAVVVVGVCGLFSGSALAGSDPGWWAGHSSADRQAVIDYVYERSAHATVPYSGDAATSAQAMSLSAIDAGSHEFPLAAELGGEEFSAVESVGLLPEITTTLPIIGAATGTFIAGFAIGTGIRKLFANMTAPQGAATGGSGWSWNELHWRPYGTEIYFGARVQQRPGAYLYSGGHSGSTFTIVRWFEAPCSFSGFSAPSPAHMQLHLSTTATCAEFNGRVWVEYPIYVDYPYLLASEIKPQRPFRPYNERTDWATATVGSPPDPGTRSVESALETLDAAGYELMRDEIDWQLTPGSQEAEEPVRIGAPTTEADRRCKEYFGDARGSDPGARSPEAPREAADWDYDVETFTEVFNPLISGRQTVKLRWGTEAWGYRHIVIEHGWNTAAAERTRLALQTDQTPQIDMAHDASGKSFVYVYDIPSLPEGMRCRQRVPVSYRTDNVVPVGRHIITSFVEAY